MKKLLLVVLMLSLVPVMSYAHDEAWEERQAKIKAIVDSRIAHLREIEVEAAKARVLAQERLLEAQNIYVSSFASNKTEVSTSSTQENTNTA